MTRRTVAPITVATYCARGDGYTYEAVFIYNPADPYAVALRLTDPNDLAETVTWWFGRDLLALGAVDESGEGDGDVRVWANSALVQIRLTSDDESAEFSFDRATVLRFLEATFLAVPKGREQVGAAVDRFIADCLAGAS